MRQISRWPGQWSSTAPQVSDHNGQRQVAWLVRGEPFRVPLLARSMVTVRSLPDHSGFERHVRVEMVGDGLHGEDATVYPWFARLEWLGPLDMTGEVDQVADGYAAVPAIARDVPVSMAHSLRTDMSQEALVREAEFLKNRLTAAERSAENKAMVLEDQAQQAELIDVPLLCNALSWLGVSTPESPEEAGAKVGHLVMDLITAVRMQRHAWSRHKEDQATLKSATEERDRLAAEVDELKRQKPVAWVTRPQLDLPQIAAVRSSEYLSASTFEQVKKGSLELVPLYAVPVAVPEGWRLVPEDPTPEMEEAGERAIVEFAPMTQTWADTAGKAYRGMLAVAPKHGEPLPPTPVEEGDPLDMRLPCDIVSVDAPALLDDDMKALDYYRACLEEREPKWVPCRVRLKSLVTGDFPIGYATVVEAGEHDCQSNKNGAISVLATNGKMLGVKPSEFEPIAWRENSPAGGAA